MQMYDVVPMIVLLASPFMSQCSAALSPNGFPPVLDRVIREKIGNNENDIHFYTANIVAAYPEMCRTGSLAKEMIEEFLNLDSIKSGLICDKTLLEDLFEDNICIALCKSFVNEYIPSDSIIGDNDPFKDIELNIYSRQLIADFEALISVMIHADKLYRYVQFRKSVLYRLGDIFSSICSQTLLAFDLKLVDNRYLSVIYYNYQRKFYENLPSVIHIFERKRKRSLIRDFDTDFDLNGLVDKRILVSKQSPMNLKYTTFRVHTWHRCKLPCITNNISTKALLQLSSDSDDPIKLLNRIQFDEFKVADSSTSTAIIDGPTISNITTDAFAFNLPYYLHPLNKLLMYTGKGAFEIFDDEELVIIHATVSLIKEYVDRTYGLYMSTRNGTDRFKRTKGQPMTRSMENVHYLYQDSRSVKVRSIVQYVVAYITSLYDYENVSISSGLVLYNMNPCVDFKSFFENSIKKQSIIFRLILHGDYAKMMYARLSRVISLATYWYQVFSFKKFQQGDSTQYF